MTRQALFWALILYVPLSLKIWLGDASPGCWTTDLTSLRKSVFKAVQVCISVWGKCLCQLFLGREKLLLPYQSNRQAHCWYRYQLSCACSLRTIQIIADWLMQQSTPQGSFELHDAASSTSEPMMSLLRWQIFAYSFYIKNVVLGRCNGQCQTTLKEFLKYDLCTLQSTENNDLHTWGELITSLLQVDQWDFWVPRRT